MLKEKNDVKKIQKQIMSKDNCNHLFGTHNGTPVGVSLDYETANRNLNTLVLSGGYYKSWSNYTRPNLLAEHSSSVIVNSITPDFISEIKSKGINVQEINFTFGHEERSTSHYNPFIVQHRPSGVKKEQAQCERALYLAKTVNTLFNDKFNEVLWNTDNIERFKNICYELIRFIFLYVGVSSNLSDSERNFSAIQTIINDMRDNGKDVLAKYDVSDVGDFTECHKHILERCEDKIFRTAADILLVVLLPLYSCDTFKEDPDNPKANISAGSFVNELTYVFIPAPLTSDGISDKLAALFIQMFIKELYDYGNSDWKRPHHALENSVHFYLQHLNEYYIPDLPFIMATCGQYGIGISVISDIYALKRLYNTDDLIANTDTIMLLYARTPWDIEFIQKFMPDLTEDDICMLNDKDKTIVCIRGYAPVICDTLKTERK